jgi:hypothetical protein
LIYHQNAFKLLQIEPIVGTQVFPNLPPSVNEWYSFKKGYSLLVEYSNQDSPLRPDEFEYHHYQNHNLAVFLHENQDVCWWAFDMDQSDDPPIYVNVKIDSDKREKWVLCCDAFSKFIFTRMFDFRYWCDNDLSIAGSGNPLDSETFKTLRENLIEQPTTYGFPGDVQYRFSRNDQRIFIWNSPEQADWHFTAETASSVLDIFGKFKHLLVWHSDLPRG